MRTISEIGSRKTVLVPDGKGSFSRKAFIRQAPKILLRNSQTPLTIRFSFTCPDGAHCNACGLSPQALKELRAKRAPTPSCLYARSIVFIDSCCHLQSSLAACVSDLNNVASKTDTPLQQLFPSTYAFASLAGYDFAQFQTIVSAKMSFPFSLCTSVSNLKSFTTIPPKEFFYDKLSNRTSVDDQSYTTFCNIWTKLGFQSLYQCLWVYSLLDSCMLVDVLAYHYIEIWKKTSLFPTFYLTGMPFLDACFFLMRVSFRPTTHFPLLYTHPNTPHTAASLAMASFLLQTKHPHDFSKRILLEFLPEDSEAIFRDSLLGGFVTNNSFFRYNLYNLSNSYNSYNSYNLYNPNNLYFRSFSNGLIEDRDFSTGIYVDANAL